MDPTVVGAVRVADEARLADGTIRCDERRYHLLLTGNAIELGRVAGTRPGDVPVYLSDCRGVFAHSSWRPRRGREDVLRAIFDWVHENERLVQEALPQ